MIEVKGLRKRSRGRDVLKGVTFTANKGQITCLIGLNGAGKSTILKMIMGLIPVGGGQILIDGEPMRKELYEKVAFIPDRLAMPPGMRLSDAMRFMNDFYGSWDIGRAEELMRFFGLNRSDKIGDMSKGTAAKFNLVLGLAQNADYVLMDEPFSGIDLFSREVIASLFSSDLVEGRGVLMTTHEVDDIEHLIDQAVLLRDGSVVREFQCEQMRIEEGKSIIDVMREVYRG